MINKKLYKFCGNTKKYIFYAVGVESLRLIAGIAFAYIFAHLISSLVSGICCTRQFLPYILVAFCIAFLKVFFIKSSYKYNFKVVREVKHSLRSSIYNKVLSMGMEYQEVLSTQELNHLSVEGVEQLENYYGSYLSQFYYAIISSIILFLSLVYFSFKIALILMIASLAIPLILQGIMSIVRNVQKKYWKKYATVGDMFLDSISGITSLKIFEADEKRAIEMDKSAESFRKQTMKVLGMQLNSIMFIDWIVYGTTGIVLVIASKMYIANELKLFPFIAILMLSAEFFVPMKMLTSKFHVAMTGVAAGESILEFLETEGKKEHGDKDFIKNSDIVLKDFSFKYPDGNEILNNINLEFKSGKFTALVGASGSGKSTIASIISHQIHSEEKVYYGGLPSNEIAEGKIYENVIRVPHNSHIFYATVRENILMGRDGISDDRIIEVLKKLKVWEFLEEQDGLDTMLLSKGKNISGGQNQRIAIARCLVHDFDVYIFDEATSNVDIESEKIILDIIKELALKKTVIYISHKMSMVSQADFVYVLENGKITEFGTPNELMDKKALYYKLYTEQENLINLNKGEEANDGK